MKTPLLVTTLALLLCGCLFPRAYHIRQPFNGPALAPYLQSGNSAIVGEAFFAGPHGQLIFPAGGVVTLIPNDPYLREYLHVRVGDPGRRISGVEMNPGQYVRETAADALGHFQFLGLPPGDYHVRCAIRWRNPAFMNPGHTSLTVVKKDVVLRAGETNRVLVNQSREL